MIQIRQGIFETNSSSTHTLCISKANYWENYWENNKSFKEWRKYAKAMCIKGGYYGRSPQKPLVSLQEKVDYLWTAVVGTYYTYDWKKGIYIESNSDKIAWWQKQILKELPNNSYFDFPVSSEIGIDHVSEMYNFIKECEKDPRYIHCLLDDDSFIEVSGDEFPNMTYAFLPRIQEKIFSMPGDYAVYVKGS